MIEARVVTDTHKDQWNAFVASTPNGHVLQSWEWGEFRERWGTPPIRIGVFEGEELKAAASFTLHRVPVINKYVGYCGKGPVFAEAQYLEPLMAGIKKAARERGCIFVKFEPHISDDPNNFFKTNLVKSKKDVFAPQTFEIDLRKSEEELLASFHSKWRYNIRLAEKKGVTVEVGESEQALREFLDLTRETAARDKFFTHPNSYYETQWEIFHPLGLAHILTAKVEGKPAASWWLFSFGDCLYYPYGSSSYEFRSFMPSHYLMWNAITFGQKMGLKTFDLWGAAKLKHHVEAEGDGAGISREIADPNDPWAGFTQFKLGFNPEYKQQLGAYDLVINTPLYHSFQAVDSIRWLILRTLK